MGGLADSMGTLIAGRAVQGLGGGGLMILALAIIADVVPARERGKYSGIMGAVFAVSSVAGPLLGGYFTDGPGWRWAFWMNIPLGILAILSAIFFLKLPKRAVREAPHRLPGHDRARARRDEPGAVHHVGRQHLRLELADHHRPHRRDGRLRRRCSSSSRAAPPSPSSR